jgi:hypothetical protein
LLSTFVRRSAASDAAAIVAALGLPAPTGEYEVEQL